MNPGLGENPRPGFFLYEISFLQNKGYRNKMYKGKGRIAPPRRSCLYLSYIKK